MKLYRIYYHEFERATGERGNQMVEIEAVDKLAAQKALSESKPGYAIRIDEIEIRGAA